MEEPLKAARAKHTPGQWSASEMSMTKKDWAALNASGGNLTIVRANWDGITGDVVACVWADEPAEEKANARLTAAAPNLLAFAEAFYAMTQEVTARGAKARPTFEQLNALLSQAMAAILKATSSGPSGQSGSTP